MAFRIQRVGATESETFSMIDILRILGDKVNDEIKINGHAYRLSTVQEFGGDGGSVDPSLIPLPTVDWIRTPLDIITAGQTNFQVNVPISDPEGLLLVVNGAMYDYGNDAAFHMEGNNLYWHGGFTLEITDRIYLKYLTLKKQP
ncbi:MAG: hypothetical protein KGO80_09035 [Bacteroidetes bacterium]|nr:hypothetical protein [Bacteroidota bacterium]